MANTLINPCKLKGTRTHKKHEHAEDNLPDDLAVFVPLDFLLVERKHGVGFLGLLEETRLCLALECNEDNTVLCMY